MEIIKKYELTTNTKMHMGRTLFQIRAVVSFGSVKKGELGGYIEKEENLSHIGDAWVFGNISISGDAEISGNVRISDNAKVSDAVCGSNHTSELTSNR